MSLGSSSEPFTSRSSRSRTTFTYSERLRRRETTRPGLGEAAASRSSAASTDPMNPSSVAASGRGEPAGGIVPPRSFRTTFSSTAACCRASLASMPVRTRSPVLSRSLWQVTQYCCINGRAVCAWAAAGACGRAEAARTRRVSKVRALRPKTIKDFVMCLDSDSGPEDSKTEEDPFSSSSVHVIVDDFNRLFAKCAPSMLPSPDAPPRAT